MNVSTLVRLTASGIRPRQSDERPPERLTAPDEQPAPSVQAIQEVKPSGDERHRDCETIPGWREPVVLRRVRLLDRHALGEVARLVDVGALPGGDVIRE